MPKPLPSESVTLRMPAEVLADIDLIAEATERSRSFIIVRALKTYLQQEGADVLAALDERPDCGGQSEIWTACLPRWIGSLPARSHETDQAVEERC